MSTTSLSSPKQRLRLISASAWPSEAPRSSLICRAAFRLHSVTHGKGVDDVCGSAWQDLLALLWSSATSSRACDEVIEVTHDIYRTDAGQPQRYEQWVRLLQADSARASDNATNLTIGLGAAFPKLAFESVATDGQRSIEAWTPRAVLRPANVRLVVPTKSGGELAGLWGYPASLPTWKLTVPLVESLGPALRINARFSNAELSETARTEAHALLHRVSSGNLRVLHPEAPLDLLGHNPALAAELMDALKARLKAQERGFKFELVISTPPGVELAAFAIRRVAFDVFGPRLPWTMTLPEEGWTCDGPIESMPMLHQQGIPGAFVPAPLLVSAFGISEQSAPPANMPTGPGALIGTVSGQPFVLPHAQTASHMLVTGGSGVGKSSFLLRLMQQWITQGEGVGCIDFHGELADALRASLPLERLPDLRWVDVNDSDFSVAVNPMEPCKDAGQDPAFLAGQILHLIKSNGETTNTWGPVAENHIRNLLLAIQANPNGACLADAARMLEDSDFADWLVSKADDSVKSHFRVWRETRGDQGIDGWKAWLLGRLHPFTKSKVLNRMLNRPSTLDLGQAMDERRIVIFRLSKSSLSEVDAQLLGATLLLEFQKAAFARSRKPAGDRVPFRLVVDEFQTCASDATPTLLREARKFNLGLILATQSLGSLKRPTVTSLKDSVLANTATKVVFRASPADAHVLDDYVMPEFAAADLTRTRNYEAVVAMAASDTQPVRVRMLQPDDPAGPTSPLPDRIGYGTRLADADSYLALRRGEGLQQ